MSKAPIFLYLLLSLSLPSAYGQSGEPTTISELLKTSSSWDGSPLPDYPQGKPEITIARITIQPGAALPLHRHPMINAGVLLSGELTVSTADHKTIHLKAGDAIAEVVNTWHFVKNDGKVPAEIVVFYAGRVGDPVTIKK